MPDGYFLNNFNVKLKVSLKTKDIHFQGYGNRKI